MHSIKKNNKKSIFNQSYAISNDKKSRPEKSRTSFCTLHNPKIPVIFLNCPDFRDLNLLLVFLQPEVFDVLAANMVSDLLHDPESSRSLNNMNGIWSYLWR